MDTHGKISPDMVTAFHSLQTQHNLMYAFDMERQMRSRLYTLDHLDLYMIITMAMKGYDLKELIEEAVYFSHKSGRGQDEKGNSKLD